MTMASLFFVHIQRYINICIISGITSWAHFQLFLICLYKYQYWIKYYYNVNTSVHFILKLHNYLFLTDTTSWRAVYIVQCALCSVYSSHRYQICSLYNKSNDKLHYNSTTHHTATLPCATPPIGKVHSFHHFTGGVHSLGQMGLKTVRNVESVCCTFYEL